MLPLKDEVSSDRAEKRGGKIDSSKQINLKKNTVPSNGETAFTIKLKSRPVSLRRYYPDQVAKGCPFPDSQMIPTPLTR